jgi:hypothetical protein
MPHLKNMNYHNSNDFSTLDAQSAESHLARMDYREDAVCDEMPGAWLEASDYWPD